MGSKGFGESYVRFSDIIRQKNPNLTMILSFGMSSRGSYFL